MIYFRAAIAIHKLFTIAIHKLKQTTDVEREQFGL
jgi:hypothetical protein